MSEYEFESLKIGAGPPPLRVEEGWLLIHHGVRASSSRAGRSSPPCTTRRARCCSTRDDPSRVLARTTEPLLSPATEEERSGTVANVVFPTAIAEVDGRRFVFYGMADSRIGVAELERG